MSDEKGYFGHATMADGSHKRLSKEEAEAIWNACEADKARRAETMPTTDDALSALSSAKERLRELGWRSAIYCPKEGQEFAVIEWGCTGIFPAVYHGEWPTGKLLYCDSFSHPDGNMFKPLADLTEAERAKMNDCIERDRQFSEREARAFGAQF